MTKLCIKILVKSDSAIQSALPQSRRQAGNEGAKAALFPSDRSSGLFLSLLAEHERLVTPMP